MSEFTANFNNCLPCCSDGNTVAFNCRTRGGTATLCGFLEYTTPSTPPKKYLIETLSGSALICGWDAPNLTCGGGNPNVVTYEVLSGAITYDASNVMCNFVNNKTRYNGTSPHVAGSPVPCAPQGTSYVSSLPAGFFGFSVSVCNFSDTLTPTKNERLYDGICCIVTPPDSGRTLTGAITSELSTEDTEDNAISRLVASSNYTAWKPVGDGSGGTCIITDCCESVYQSRTNATTFAYTESQYRANIQSSNSTAYSLMAEIWRCPYGFANYALYSYQITGFTTNATGFASVVVNVPITKGYLDYAANGQFY